MNRGGKNVAERERSRWEEIKAAQPAEDARVIAEFRANEGRVERYPFPVIIVHHKGAKSGKERANPLAYLPVDENFAVFATRAGSDSHPDWYYNLVANPLTTVEVGGETYKVRARVTSGEERERIFERQKAEQPHFDKMDQMTDREIPVVLFERL
jgi:deazaflavin-dependent oxidoreductase (nitroreductase family)